MSDTTFAFIVDEELKARFAQAAAARATTSEDLLREFMSETVEARGDEEYDAWFRREIQEAVREADDPTAEWISNDDVQTKWEKIRAAVTRADSD